MSDAVRDYILSMLIPDSPVLLGLGKWYEGRTDIQPAVGPEVGKLLGLLVRLAQATRVLELGTCLGYSTVWLAQAMEATGGQLTSVELDHALVEETWRSVEEAGLSHRVRLIEGDAAQVLSELTGPFDLIFQDSAKPLYPELFERSVQLTTRSSGPWASRRSSRTRCTSTTRTLRRIPASTPPSSPSATD